ncbi:MAG: ABC transporter permease [Candidatus Latescibacteria bacterium]|nr:ABC transporter permease [Candidatus Latescibacterota bacterium]
MSWGLIAILGGLLAAPAGAQLRPTVERLAALGSRMSGYPGAEQAAALMEQGLRQAGVEEVKREEFQLAVPMDQGGWVRVVPDGEAWPMHGFWPNLVVPSTLPPGGVDLPLIWGGTGEWEELAGQEVAGRAVLMEFNSWDHWLRVASLGARAVLFAAPARATWGQGVTKSVQVPLELPRFWVEGEAGQFLRRQLEQGPVQVHLEARMEWAQRPAWNIWGMVPGRDPALQKELIVVEAYYDASSAVPGLAPGAEQAGAAAALLELAAHLRDHPPARSVVLVAAGAHFQGRRGIADFLDRHARRHPHYAQRQQQPLNPRLFISLDLSSQTDQLGIWNNTYSFDRKRFFVPLGRRFTGYAEEAGQVLANGISPIKGMDWSSYMPGGLSPDSEMALQAGLVSLVLATVNDARYGVDTPQDLPGQVDFPNLERQVDLLLKLLDQAFADPELFAELEDFTPVFKDNLRTLRVVTRTFPQRSQIPDRPVANAVVVVGFPYNQKGVRWAQYYLSDGEGQVEAQGLEVGIQPVAAFVLDPQSGGVVYAPDLGERGSRFHGGAAKIGLLSSAVRWDTNEKLVVLFPCIGSPFYGLIDPRQLSALDELKVLDSKGAAPRQFGFMLESPVGVVFGSPGQALKLLVGKHPLLLLNSQGGLSEEDARGTGYVLGSQSLLPTELMALQDMWQLDEARLQTMRRHAIENQRLTQLHQRGGALLAQAREGWEKRQWPAYVAAVRAALGVTARAYPEVLGTLNDVMKGLVFFLALVIPAAFFGERLLLAAADIHRQLAGCGVLLALIWLLISQIHPAFEIAHPLVILLGFAIMAMACFVLVLISGRFNRYSRERRARAARVHDTDISRGSAAYVAFMLGISNMRRRRLRTGLTLVTLTLLTFTVLSFTAFREQVRYLGFALPDPAPYPGVLIRDRGWSALSPATLEYARSHFGAGVCPRNWYLTREAELLEQQEQYIQIRCEGQSEQVLGLLGLSPGEAGITGIAQALRAGTFFASEDEASCLVSEGLARRLGIDPGEVGRTQIQVFGRSLVVRGIADGEKLEALRDLDHEPLTPADFKRSSTQLLGPAALLETTVEKKDKSLEITPFVHLDADQVLILPYQILREAGGTLRSVAVRLGGGEEDRILVEDFLLRFSSTLFASLPDPGSGQLRVYSYTSVGLTAVEGLGAVLVPMAIAALIVLNAMLGAVYERYREIGIYSSVGLAPRHIAWLFVAESCVYAVLGVTLGYILGQGAGKILLWAGLAGGINLNYSSLAAIAAALLVMGVVLVSTIYPARLAAQSAVPDTVRRWQPPPPAGDRWVFAFPFMVSHAEVLGLCGFLTNYFRAQGEAALGNFFTEQVRIVREGEERGVQLLLWLAPFDLGLCQFLQLGFGPSGVAGVCAVEVYIERLSGQHAFWQRANQRFMNRLRREFLLWNTLGSEERAFHRQAAEGLLKGEDGQAQG